MSRAGGLLAQRAWLSVLMVTVASCAGDAPPKQAPSKPTAPEQVQVNTQALFTEYMQTITVANPGAAQTNFQVRLNIPATNTNFWNNLDGGASATGHDIHIQDSTNAELPFWIERLDTTADVAWIWVKIPSIAGTPATATLRIFYGNQSQAASSSITNTMIFGDDFSAAAVDTTKWTVTSSGSWTQSGNGLLRITNSNGRLASTTAITTGMVLESKFKINTVGGNSRIAMVGVKTSTNTDGHSFGINPNTTGVDVRQYSNTTVTNQTFGGNYSSGYGRVTLNVIGTGASTNTSNLVTWPGELNSLTHTYAGAYTPGATSFLTLGLGYAGLEPNITVSVDLDWVLARKYVASASQPTLTINNNQTVVQKANGTECSAAAGCTSGNCVDGYCCNSTCAGACDVCAASLGASADGTCTNSAAGYVGSPSCTPYLCSGSAGACPSTCASDAVCISSNYCNGTNCVADKANGMTCTAASQCTSGNCVDGYCCDTACGGGAVDCQACSVAAGAPANGTCSPSVGNVCRTSAGGCDAAETCPAMWRASNVNAGLWTDYSTAPNWSCTAAGTTIVDTTGTGAGCPAITGDTCGGTAILTHCTNTVSQLSGTTNVMVVRLQGLTVSNGHVIRVKGDKPIMFLVDGDVTVGGSGSAIDASSYRSSTAPADGAAGPGASSFTCAGGIGGNGQISGGSFADENDGGGGGGGGGFGASGGNGGYGDDNWSGTADGGPGGSAEGSLFPLRPGCRGGTGGDAIPVGGAYGLGGGAIQISARGNVVINAGGVVKANGAGGAGGGSTTNNNDAGSGGGGGGSGGAVLIEGATVMNGGSVLAYGGGGGGGGGSGSSATVGGNGIDGGAGGSAGGGARPGRAGGAGGTTGAGTAGTNTTEVYSAGGAGGGGAGRTTLQTSPASGPAAGGSCPADTVSVAGTVCRGTTDVCDAQETCTGTSGACPTDAFASNATSCRGTAGECDLAELCTGTAAACPADVKKAAATACSTDSNPCTTDLCNGTSVACIYTAGNAGTSCRGTAGTCDLQENCTGTSTACPTDLFVSSATSCRGTAGECDLAENCTGTAAACPTDAKRANGTACTADANVCTKDECDGSAVTCQHPAGNAGTLCNATTGVCDVAEVCTGSTTTCPMNAYAASSVVCRATAGECDVAENCTGVSDACPSTDAKRAAGFACTADAVTCSADICDGTTNVCQHPAGNAGLSCRATGGACDAAEACTGTSTTCPADILTPGGVSCRATAGFCDIAETCTGTSNACPSDSVQSSAVVCRASAGFCDVAPENCTGTTAACPADTYKSSAITCRATTGVCDLVEMCTGSAAACPADVMSTAVCRGTTGVCDAAEVCTGTGAACPADIVASSATPCRFQANICDAIDFCTGLSGVCPSDTYAPVGTDCGYTTGATTIYATGATSTNVVQIVNNYSAAAVANAGPNSAWTDATRYQTTLPVTSGNSFLYQQISAAGRNFRAYDLIEYDVYLASPQAQLGGIDVENGTTALRALGLVDQNGNGVHPVTDLVSDAYGTWYHRRIAVAGTSFVNTTSTAWSIVDENDAAHGAYTAYYDNLIVAATGGECDGANNCKIAVGYGCTAVGDCASGQCGTVSLDASNTHRWPLDTNVTASIGGQNGTTSGTVTWAGNGAVLSGGASGPYISVPTAVMSGLTSVTFEAWFTMDTQTTWQRIFDFGNDNTENIFLTTRFDTGNVPRVGYRRDSMTELNFNSTVSFATGTLTHVALSVAGGASMTLYVNGTNAGSRALTGTDTLTAITFDQNYLGNSNYGDPKFDGTIYDFRVYNKALSEAEVLATYRKGVDSKVCIAQYPIGTPCASASECSSGFCVDDRCCNNACDNTDTTNCQACSIAAGAAANGTCGTVTSGVVCRPTVDVTCDIAETCTGTSTACPADNN